MTHAAFLGTGLLGSAMVEAARSRGEEVVVWNRSPEKTEPLHKLGATVAATAGDAVRDAARVHLVLKDDEAVDSVLASCRERLKGSLVVDHTTTSPRATAARAAQLAEQGIDYLHAPVFMSPRNARQSQGAMLVSGRAAVFQRVREPLEAMTSKVEYLGERTDLAASYKLFGNAMIMMITAGLADVLAMAGTLGIDSEDAMKVFSIFNPVSTLDYRGAAMAQGDFTASFELAMARKDIRLMIEAGQDGEVPLQILPVLARWMDRLIAEGHGHEDLGVLGREAVLGRVPLPPPSRGAGKASN